jgi:hypothetical protein
MDKNYFGISFPFLLGTVFIILRLCHVIAWSWWLATLPFWGDPPYYQRGLEKIRKSYIALSKTGTAMNDSPRWRRIGSH